MTFLEAAIEVLKREGKPLPTRKLAELAVKHNLLSVVGRDPEGTMQVRLEDALAKDGAAIALWMVKPGVYGLREYPPQPYPARAAEAVADTKREPAGAEAEAAAQGDDAKPSRRRRGRRGRGGGTATETADAGESPAGEAGQAAVGDAAPAVARNGVPAEGEGEAAGERRGRRRSRRGGRGRRREDPAKAAAPGEPESALPELEPMGEAAADASEAPPQATVAAGDDELLEGSDGPLADEVEEEFDLPGGPVLAPSLGAEDVTRTDDEREVRAEILGRGGEDRGRRRRRERGGRDRPRRPGETPDKRDAGAGGAQSTRGDQSRGGAHAQSARGGSAHGGRGRGESGRGESGRGQSGHGGRGHGGHERGQSGHGGRGQSGDVEGGRGDSGRGDSLMADAGRGDAGRADGGRGEAGRSDGGRGEGGRADGARGDSGRGEGGREREGRGGGLLEAAIEVMRGEGGRPMHVRHLTDLLVKRKAVEGLGGPNEVTRQLRVLLVREQREREADGLRARVRPAGGGQWALVERRLEQELVPLERELADKAARLSRATVAAIRRRIGRLPAAAFEALGRALVEKLGVTGLELVRRGDGVVYYGGQRTLGSGSLRMLIALRAGEAEVNRRAIGELRAGLSAKGFDQGLLLAAGRAGDEGLAELKAGGGVTAYDGLAMAELCVRQGVGVRRLYLPVDYLDVDLFSELTES